MRSTHAFLLALALGVFTAWACGPSKPACTASTCAQGCCDASGVCQPGSSSNACGQGGVLCQQCFIGTVCSLGTCVGGSGGGSGQGGGTGGGAMGGGTGGGTGGGATGGGTGGGATGGGTGGGATGGGTGGGATGGGAGGGGGTPPCSGCLLSTTCVPLASQNTSTCGVGGEACYACPSGSVCSGGTCLGGSSSGLPGSTCTTGLTTCAAPTGESGFCIDSIDADGGASGWTNGYCSATCSAQNCPAGVCLTVGTQGNFCFGNCTGPGTGTGSCRGGYVCEGLNYADGGPAPTGICWPDCRVGGAAGCGTSGTCDGLGYCR